MQLWYLLLHAKWEPPRKILIERVVVYPFSDSELIKSRLSAFIQRDLLAHYHRLLLLLYYYSCLLLHTSPHTPSHPIKAIVQLQ